MVRAVRPLRSLRMARGCARIDSRTRYSKNRLSRSPRGPSRRLLAVIGVRKTFPHGLDQKATSFATALASRPMLPVTSFRFS